MATPHTQRLKCDKDARFSQVSLTAEMWKGRATTFLLGLFAGNSVVSIEDITSVTLRVKLNRDASDADVMVATVAADALVQITGSQWTAKTHATATMSFTNAQCNLNVDGNSTSYWITVEALLENGDRVIFGAGNLIVHSAAADAVGDPDANPGAPITLEEADARYMRGAFRLALSEDADRIHFYSTSGVYRGSLDLMNYGQPDLES